MSKAQILYTAFAIISFVALAAYSMARASESEPLVPIGTTQTACLEQNHAYRVGFNT